MKWIRVDTDAPNDIKIQALLRRGASLAPNGAQAWAGATWLLWCYIGAKGKGGPGEGVRADGSPLDPLEMSIALHFGGVVELEAFLAACADVRLIDPTRWSSDHVVFLPAMASRADEYSKKKARGAIERRPFRKSGMTRREIFERDDYTCRACRKVFEFQQLEVDHIVAVSAGGTDDPANLQTLCRSCNRRKGPRGFVAKPGRTPDKVEVSPRNGEAPVCTVGSVDLDLVTGSTTGDQSHDTLLDAAGVGQVERLVEIWNLTAHPALPRIAKITDERRRAYSKALKAHPNLAEWSSVIAWLNTSAWWRGERRPASGPGSDWTGNLGYLASKGKFQDAVERMQAAGARQAGRPGAIASSSGAAVDASRGRTTRAPGTYAVAERGGGDGD